MKRAVRMDSGGTRTSTKARAHRHGNPATTREMARNIITNSLASSMRHSIENLSVTCMAHMVRWNIAR